MLVANGSWAEQAIQILIQYRGIWGTLLGALIGSFSGAYLQRKWEERRRRLQEIYKPLFNEVSAVLNHKMPHGPDGEEIRSIWEEFEFSKKFLTDDEISKKVEEYVDYLQEFSMLENIASELSNQSEYYAEQFAQTFPDEVITKRDDGGVNIHTGPNQGMNLYIWLNRYGHFIYVADSAEELRENLIQHSGKEGNASIFQYWNREIPDWPQHILDIKKELCHNRCKELQEKGEAYASL